MIALIQRVTRASVTVEGEVTGEIGAGLLVLLGVEKDDDEQKANRLCERVLGYRIFSDAEGKMNLNVQRTLPPARDEHTNRTLRCRYAGIAGQ